MLQFPVSKQLCSDVEIEMRLIVSALVFVVASVTIVGILLTIVLSAPGLGLSGSGAIMWVVGVGFVCAIPVSYWIAGKIIAETLSTREPT